MKITKQSLPGTKDYWPEDLVQLQTLEKLLISHVESWGYQEVRTPILEPLNTFLKLGADSDIIGKQMYYVQHAEEKIVLRPEGTAGVMRSGIEHHKIINKNAKIWYYGPMFRHERPQKGRLREFHQFGCEIFGYQGISIEVELLDMLQLLWKKLKIENINLEINSIGSIESRKNFKAALVAYLDQYYNDLDPDSQRRLSTNPLRILDTKIASTKAILADAPTINNFLSTIEKKHIDNLLSKLSLLGHSFTYNPLLVRGLDYYNDLVFEYVSSDLGAQSTFCAGGRFDSLGNDWSYDIPALGYSIGVERLLLISKQLHTPINAIIIAFTQVPEAEDDLLQLLNLIRMEHTGAVIFDHSKANFSNKYHRALKQNPSCIITIEEQNWQLGNCTIRIPGQELVIVKLDFNEILNVLRK